MRLKRLVTVLAVVLVVVVGLAVAAVGWVGTSTSGARFVLERVIAATGGALTVGELDGSLSEALVLSDLRYRDAAHEVAIDRVALRVDLFALAGRVLVVDDLRSSVVRYRALGPAPAPAAAAGEPLTLPLTLRVDRASIEGISIARDEGSLELERIVIAGAAEDTTALLQRLELRVADVFLSMQGALAWGNGLDIDGLVSWSAAVAGDTWLGSAEVAGRWPVFAIEQEMLSPIEQTASGTIYLDDALLAELQVQWPGLGDFELAAGRDAGSEIWQASIAGSGLVPAALVPGWPGVWRVAGSFNVTLAEQGFAVATDELLLEGSLGDQNLELEFAGALDSGGELAIDQLVARLGANRLQLSGTAGSAIDIALTAELVDLAAIARLAARDEIRALEDSTALATGLTGSASAELAISGTWQAPLASGSVVLADSTYAGLPLAAALQFSAPAAGATALTVERLQARLGATRVSGSGRVEPALLGGAAAAAATPLEFALELSADDLAELAELAGREEIRALTGTALALDGLAGLAVARVELSGTLGRPELTGVVNASGLRYAEQSLASAALSFDAGLYEGGASMLGLQLADESFAAELTAAGTIRGNGWSGTVESLELEEPWLGLWTLEAPVELAAAPGRIDIGAACVRHRNSGICGEWHYGGVDDRLRLSASAFDLAVLSPLLPPEISVAGPVSFEATLDSPGGRPVGSLSASSGVIEIAIGLSEAETVTATIDSIALEAMLDDYALAVDAAVESSTLGHADIALTTADIRDPDAPIGGSAEIEWPDLSVLTLLSPDVGEVGGTVALALELAGTAASPEISGSGTLSDGRVAIPQWGVLVDRISGEAQGSAGRTVRYRGSGFIEDAEIRVAGETELDPAANWPTRLTLQGDNVPVASRPDATVIASPDFAVEIRLPRIDVSGTVLVPEALLAVEQLPNQAVRESADSVVHGALQQAEVRPLELNALVAVELGDNVRYTGSNLDTQLSGALTIEYISGRSPIAGGRVGLDGSYQAYGQTLTLDSGELLFAGPLDDPAIDVLAAKTVGQNTIGVRLSGTLRAPLTTLYSNPPLSDLNVLSYLAFNRPAQGSGEEESSALQAAALALGIQQALPAVQRVGETLGLDELTIEATEIDAGSLMAGKYLSPRVYLSYTYGLFNRLGGFLLRYDINDRFSLETRSGDEKAMDLLYSVEKD